MAFKISLIENDSSGELFNLRREAYFQRYANKIDISQLRYNSTLHQTLNIGLYENNSLVSAYRLDGVKSTSAAKYYLQSKNSILSDFSEIVIGCRACTNPNYQNRGYHLILRKFAIELLVDNSFDTMMGTFESQSHWRNCLQDVGYSFIDVRGTWNDFLVNESPTVLSYLNISKFGSFAIEALQRKILQKCPNIQIEKTEVSQNRITFWKSNFDNREYV